MATVLVMVYDAALGADETARIARAVVAAVKAGRRVTAGGAPVELIPTRRRVSDGAPVEGYRAPAADVVLVEANTFGGGCANPHAVEIEVG